ncbi:MAG TPA: GNVR domain-containing protein, partial [Longimicrobium sp.]|nr:GNVR domain-containing protein [Longimicrobium sp.]
MTAAPPDDPTTSRSSLRDIRGTISRHRWLVLGTTAATIALVALYTSSIARSYESVTTLRLATDEGRGSMLSQLGPLAGMGLLGLGGDEVTTEIGVLRSRTVADEVAAAVGLHVELVKPEEPRGTVLRVISAPRDATQGIYTLRRQSDGSYRASVEENEGTPRLPARVTIGQPFQAGGATLALAPSLASDPPGEVRFQIHSFRRTVEGFREAMLVGRDESSSKLLEVSYRHTDPVLAAAVVNRVAESFIRYKASTSNTESRSTVALLRTQIAVYQRQLREAEDRLQNFQESQQVINPLAESTQQVRRLAEMQVRRDEMQVERASLAALLAQVRARGGRADEPSPYRKLATFPSFIANAGIQSILETLTTLESERSTLLARRTETDPDVQQLTERVRQLELQLYQLGTSYLGSIDNQLASMGTVLNQFSGELQRIPARDVEFARLTREQKLLSEVYLSLQGRLKEAEIQAAVDNGEVRVVDAGLVSEDPVSPKPMVNLILATVLGLMLGFTAAFGKD